MSVQKQTDLQWYCYAVAYSPFLTIFLGVTSNPLTFLILRSDKELNLQSSMTIFSFISILNIFTLFTWNLNAYFNTFYNFNYYTQYLITCKLMMFLQYFGFQSSALLTSFVSIDRYFTIISRPGSKLPFGTPRKAFIWSAVITILVVAINFHILILNGRTTSKFENKTFISGKNVSYSELKETAKFTCNIYSNSFNLAKYWVYVNTILYSVIPSIVMIIFNGLIIVQTLKLGISTGRTTDQRLIEANKKKRHITYSLIRFTVVFLVVTLMACIFFVIEFYNKQTECIRSLISFFEFLFHSTLFFDLYVTNIYFRKAVHRFFKRKQ